MRSDLMKKGLEKAPHRSLMKAVGLTDEELVARCNAGDTDSFNQLILRWERPMYALAYRQLGREEDAHDVVQDAFMTVMQQAERFDSGRGAVTPWLCGIAKNKIRAQRRRQRPVLIEDVLAEARTAFLRMRDAGRCDALDAAFDMLVGGHRLAAAAFGLPKDEALKAVTLYAAQILGIADRVGSLEKGKDATLMITDGDPLELSTSVLQVYIQGRKADMRDKHKQLYGKYQEKYKQIR